MDRHQFGLATEVEGKACIGNLNDEKHVGGRQPLAAEVAVDDEIGRNEGGFGELQGGLGPDAEARRQAAGDQHDEVVLEALMDAVLRVHRDELSLDQLDPLIVLQNAGLQHAEGVLDGECPSRQTFGSLGDHHVHRVTSRGRIASILPDVLTGRLVASLYRLAADSPPSTAISAAVT